MMTMTTTTKKSIPGINDDNDNDATTTKLENFVWQPATVPGSRAL